MLWTVALLMAVLWAVGLISSYTMGGMIHVLLVLAILSVVAQLVVSRRFIPQKARVGKKSIP
ncbi:MAG: lmo0937 family membrane protein [Deltaproteobacteria bacterium]|nr:lmo0937 family membrane protein [Deltaproteobacteria bacterium]